MENEPFLSTQPQLQPIPELSSFASLPEPLSTPLIFHEIEPHPPPPPPLQTTTSSSDSSPPATTHLRKIRSLQRSKTAPAMVVMRDLKPTKTPQLPRPNSDSTSSIVRRAIFLLSLYLSLGVIIYSLNRDKFSGSETHPVVDALYFCIVTMCTIGYGDIAPLTPGTKAFAVVFVLFGFGFIDILLSGVVNYVLDLQERMILAGIQMGKSQQHHHHHRHHHHRDRFSARNYIVDVEKGRMRIRLKVGLALGVVVCCIGMGALVLCSVEGLDWVDSIYLAVMSVTTVGYGDRAFKTLPGRLFAAAWLLVSTLAVARAFLYLAEFRVDKRHRRITNWVLHRDITVEDLLAADMNNTGFIRALYDFCISVRELGTSADVIGYLSVDYDVNTAFHRDSKSEYVIYKLKEMGKIGEKDILQVCNQFTKLDPNNLGKITLPDLLENRL